MANYGINCCKNCVPPKRHTACHDTCKEYIKEKAIYQKQMEEVKKNKVPCYTPSDFNKIVTATFKYSRGRKR